ncbi:hypothetical protein [Flavobacterium daemonense]|uniref:hypothetical protein n=1 Tax=Flavobacterium daemonense TaxID=1393049 RepID=UPI001186BCE6|nr:hypothetical protein [Flavobacterium daemonense]KAF2335460.1 hypothetical protein FND99_04680 [Flavobacterium daemonense]
MEIALNSFVLFLLFIFPGIVFRRFYYVGEFSKQFNSGNWINTIYISLVPGLIIQIISYFAFVNLINANLSFNNFEFINSIYKKIKKDSLPKELFNFELLSWIFLYLFTTVFISFIIAQICWKVVRTFNLDIQFSTLRFNNYWHYYLSGESLKFKDFKGLLPDKSLIVALTEADVLVDVGNDGTKLYKGLIRQHTICKNSGDLKAIYLTDVRRYRKNFENNSVEIKDVPGHIMILPAEKIININLTYITRHKKQTNYSALILGILNLIILAFLMFNPSNIFLRNTTLFGDIIGRIWLFLEWLIIGTFFDTLLNSKKHENIKSLRYGLLSFFVAILLIIYFWFYR